MRSLKVTLAAVAAAAMAPAGASAAGPEGPPERPDTRQVMFVGNNWDGTADIVDARTYQRLGRINVIPDRAERESAIQSNPVDLAFFLAIRQQVGEGHDQFTDDMFTSHDGRFVFVSRPSFADVVGIDLRTHQIVWRFEMEGQRADHMGVSPDGTKLLVSDSTANKVHEIDTATGKKTGEFPSGDSPHESNYSRDGKRIYHASIGRVYTPSDDPRLGIARDTTKGERIFEIVDADSLEVLRSWDMGQKLEEAGYPEMESAVRPMALSPDERYVYAQISFHHGYIEYDLQQDRVTRVINLPLSQKAADTPREEYLLDSAHHGLAMNDDGTKLCVAGTMSDYAAIVSRQTSEPHIFQVGQKPYWSTNGLNDTCWVSVSGDDQVVVYDYNRERELARVPVGDHPQRVRLGAIQTSYLPNLPVGAGGMDTLAPRIRIRGVPKRCRRKAFRVRVRVRDQSKLRSVVTRADKRRLRRTKRKSFKVRVPVRKLKRGRHRLRVTATDTAGNRGRKTVRFRRCRS